MNYSVRAVDIIRDYFPLYEVVLIDECFWTDTVRARCLRRGAHRPHQQQRVRATLGIPAASGWQFQVEAKTAADLRNRRADGHHPRDIRTNTGRCRANITDRAPHRQSPYYYFSLRTIATWHAATSKNSGGGRNHREVMWASPTARTQSPWTGTR
jgi:hypothetical protein